MSDTAQDEKRIRDEAAGWYARLNNTTITTDTLRAFREWRRDERHAGAYADIEAFWVRAGKLKHDEDIAQAAKDALDRKSRAPSGPLPKPGGRSLAAVALVIALSAGLAAAWPFLVGRVYDTGIGEQRVVRLADGSRVNIDTQSRIRVRYRNSVRQVRLEEGRAYFDVARDPSRPFRVQAGSTEIQALGTAFDIRRTHDLSIVTLAEGRVRVSKADQSWDLNPGQQIQVSDQGAVSRVQEADLNVVTSWTIGRLVFRSQPLEAALAEVNRYNPAQIQLADPALGQAPVSGVFDTGDSEAFVAAISDLFDLEVAARDDKHILLRAGR
ncbi:FecR family protein [Phenylobacterium sp.]|uniref:FecR family protein n=1 Tax=Phenylobacterium sp. TaxID=1871053 RepID=UPI00272FE6A9|nr:FecR family protein [Phenylobacterium sp.]MDP1875190.1 FecR family protein [Phenylobacterium sp.]